MATPRIDKISVALAARIADPVASASTDGNVLTANERTSYVNRALHELFRKYWAQVEGDKQRFIQIFPELLKTRAASFTYVSEPPTIPTATKYTIAANNLDFYELVDAELSGVYYRVLPSTLFNTVSTGRLLQYTPIEAKPAIIVVDKQLYVFPKTINSSGGLTGVQLNMIVQPLNPTDGSFLTQNGNYDSPFMDTWNEEIVTIAAEMFLQDTQEK